MTPRSAETLAQASLWGHHMAAVRRPGVPMMPGDGGGRFAVPGGTISDGEARSAGLGRPALSRGRPEGPFVVQVFPPEDVHGAGNRSDAPGPLFRAPVSRRVSTRMMPGWPRGRRIGWTGGPASRRRGPVRHVDRKRVKPLNFNVKQR